MQRFFILLIFLIQQFIAYCQNLDGTNLFNDDFLHEIKFEFVDTTTFIEAENYQKVKMIIDGKIVDSIGFKRKGNISEYTAPNKFGIKVKTNEYAKGKQYDGIKEFTLHINFQDPSMLREKLTYDLCATMGLYSLRTAFAKVYINQVYWGLYTLVEGKDEMYKQIFGSRNLDAIETLDFGNLCYISNNPQDYDSKTNGGFPAYVLENGNASTAWKRFSTMIDKANNTSDNHYLSTVPKYLNIEDFFTYQALNVYLMNMDSYIAFRGNQIFMYDTIANIWQIIPWDFNASFGLWNTDNFSPIDYPMIPSVIKNGCVAGKMNEIPTLKNYYLDAICKLNTILGDTTTYFAKIDNWKKQIGQAVYTDYRKHVSNADFDKAINYGTQSLFQNNVSSLKTFIQQRNALIKQELTNLKYTCQTTSSNEDIEVQPINIFPNPAYDFIRFEQKDLVENQQKIMIRNAISQIMLNENSTQNQTNVAHLPSGLYFVEIKIGNTVYKSKFIKL